MQPWGLPGGEGGFSCDVQFCPGTVLARLVFPLAQPPVSETLGVDRGVLGCLIGRHQGRPLAACKKYKYAARLLVKVFYRPYCWDCRGLCRARH